MRVATCSFCAKYSTLMLLSSPSLAPVFFLLQLWHTWGGLRPCLRKTRFPADVMSGMRHARDGTVLLLLPAAADASRSSFEFEDYGIGHFDAVIAQRRSPAFDGQDPIPRRKRRERGY